MTSLRNWTGRIFSWITEHPGLSLACLSSLTILGTTLGHWSTDLNRAGDDLYHLANEAQVALAIAQGRSPFGPVDIMFGSPMLKFYQPTFYLITGSLNALLGIPLIFLHNVLTVLGFALSPFALHWSYRTLGLSDLAAGLGALLTLGSAAAFGNSYEAYFQAGIVTQSLGAVLFPLFIGRFALLLKEKKGPLGAASLFALTFVSHAIMAVYAVLAGALLFAVGRFPLRRLFFRLAAFSVLSVLLVVFWLVPFIGHQERHRPVPDLVLRAGTTIWFVGLSPAELNRQLFPGRLLDDAKVLHAEPQGADDSLTDRLNIMGTLVVRTPYITALVLLGFLLCLLRLHSLAHRFLLSGFVFSLLLLLGPDDVPWLYWVPFASRIQAFRCVYLIEFFAFGLAGAGLQITIHWYQRQTQHRPAKLRRGLRTAGVVLCLGGLAFHGVQIGRLVDVHVDLRPKKWLDLMHDVTKHSKAGFPLRVSDNYDKADKKRNAYMAIHGLRSICGHWSGVGPSIGRTICSRLQSPLRSSEFNRRMGIGQYLVGRATEKRLREYKTEQGTNPFRRVKRGRGHYLFRDRQATYLWADTRAALVVANDAQWYYLASAWTSRQSSQRKTGQPLLPVRLPPDEAISSAMLEHFEAVWVLQPDDLAPGDLDALGDYAAAGGAVRTVAPLVGVEAKTIASGRLELLSPASTRAEAPPVKFRKIRFQLGGPIDYIVKSDRRCVVLLPELAVAGWRAMVDGRPTATFAAGPDLVAMLMPAGKHRVSFQWATPPLEMAMIVISAIAWSGLGAALVVGRLRRRRS